MFLQQDEATVVYLAGSLELDDRLKVTSDTSIIGVGSDAVITGGGLRIEDASNVIVQNLVINKVVGMCALIIAASVALSVSVTRLGCGVHRRGLTKLFPGDDAINIQESTNVWIDHNEFFSDADHGFDYYDGLLDITHGCDFITVSYNYFHDHYKVSSIALDTASSQIYPVCSVLSSVQIRTMQMKVSEPKVGRCVD